MRKGLVSSRLQCVRRLKLLRAHGSPLPQGEGGDEGFSRATRAGRPTPHLDPLPFSEERGEKRRVLLWCQFTGPEVVGVTSR
jgi:hypothetical protein